MKTKLNRPSFSPPHSALRMLALLGFIILHSTFILPASAQGTAFTYQGRLNDGASVANGVYDLRFTIFDAASGGFQVPWVTNSATAVSNGLFTVTLDFGNVFYGAGRWLEVAVRTNGGGAFTILDPRQALTPTPYAIFAGGASNLVGAVSSANLAGTYSQAVTLNNPGNVFAGNGAGVTNVNAVTLGGISSAGFWRTNGNANANPTNGAFLGTTDNLPLELKVNGQRALRLEPNVGSAPNVIAGAATNTVGVGAVGATVSGGDQNVIGRNGSYSAIGGGLGGSIQANATGVTIGGGFNNTVQSNATTATISGGGLNTIQPFAFSSAIGGGSYNTIQTNSYYATVAGGESNLISLNTHHATIGGGTFNVINVGAFYATIGGGNYHSIGVNGAASTVGGGYNNSVGSDSSYSTVSGGSQNAITGSASYNLIGGGNHNEVGFASTASLIGGGANNLIFGFSTNSVISGGAGNFITGFGETISGGTQNTARGNWATIGGGETNTANGYWTTIGGGLENTAGGGVATVGGGSRNDASGNYATVGGGDSNRATNDSATVSGGNFNSAIGANATVGGGSQNRASGDYATVAGGGGNFATNDYATVAGGGGSLAGGKYSFAAGLSARAIHHGSFVWADAPNFFGVNFSSTSTNQFLLRAGGGVGINTSNPVVPLTVEGKGAYNSLGAAAIAVRNPTAGKTWEWHVLDDGRMQFADLGAGATRMVIDTNGNVSANSFITTSDRHAKENFAPVNAQDVLAKVAALPISQWNFKSETAVQHVGPMAQDFRAAFGLGPDEQHIATVDADGVAFAAIQGLNQKLEAQKAENAELKAQLNELKVLVKQLAEGKQK